MQRGKFGPLIGSQRPPHPEQHHGSGFVQLCAGDFDAPDLLHDGAVVTLLYESLELGFSLIQRLLLNPEGRHCGLKDVLEPTALFGGQSKFPFVEV